MEDKKMHKTTVTVKNYQSLAMTTCLPECKNSQYWGFGFQSELHELLSKVEGVYAKEIRGDKIGESHINGVKSEIGDCFWFVALGCEIIGSSFQNVFEAAKSNSYDKILSIHYFDKSRIEFKIRRETLISWCAIVKGACKEMDIKPIDCLKENIEKLSSRQDRGQIKGNGDNR